MTKDRFAREKRDFLFEYQAVRIWELITNLIREAEAEKVLTRKANDFE